MISCTRRDRGLASAVNAALEHTDNVAASNYTVPSLAATWEEFYSLNNDEESQPASKARARCPPTRSITRALELKPKGPPDRQRVEERPHAQRAPVPTTNKARGPPGGAAQLPPTAVTGKSIPLALIPKLAALVQKQLSSGTRVSWLTIQRESDFAAFHVDILRDTHRRWDKSKKEQDQAR